MNIGQIKVLCWGSAGLLSAGLALYVGLFVKDLERKRTPPDPNLIAKELDKAEAVKAKAADLVAYDDVRRLYLPQCDKCKELGVRCRHLNWTGKPPPPPDPKTNNGEPSKPPAVAMNELVKIQYCQVDLSDRKLSRVWLKYRPKAAVQNNTTAGGGFWMKEGDHLAAPHDYARIEKIDSQAVTFAFEDGRGDEKIYPDEFDSKTTIVQVDQDGVIRPKLGGVPKGDVKPWQPTRTTAYGTNRFMLGTDDMAYANENYAKILADEVRTGRHQDPRTGKYDGIEVESVTPNSFAERHGAQEGDVIKSINGQPVTSVQEAITYAKNNADKYSSWEIVVENRGKTRTVVYESPRE